MKVGTTGRYFVDTLGDMFAPGTRIFSPLAVPGLCVTMCRYMYLFQPFNGALRRSILPIRTHSAI